MSRREAEDTCHCSSLLPDCQLPEAKPFGTSEPRPIAHQTPIGADVPREA